MAKNIPQRYFEELVSLGHTVPRYETDGKVIPFSVGKIYTIKGYVKNQQAVKAKCTQDCPHVLKLIDI